MSSISKERLSQIIEEELTFYLQTKKTNSFLLNEASETNPDIEGAREFNDLIKTKPKLVAKALQSFLRSMMSGKHEKEVKQEDVLIVYRYAKKYDEEMFAFFDRGLGYLLEPQEILAFQQLIDKETKEETFNKSRVEQAFKKIIDATKNSEGAKAGKRTEPGGWGRKQLLPGTIKQQLEQLINRGRGIDANILTVYYRLVKNHLEGYNLKSDFLKLDSRADGTSIGPRLDAESAFNVSVIIKSTVELILENPQNTAGRDEALCACVHIATCMGMVVQVRNLLIQRGEIAPDEEEDTKYTVSEILSSIEGKILSINEGRKSKGDVTTPEVEAGEAGELLQKTDAHLDSLTSTEDVQAFADAARGREAIPDFIPERPLNLGAFKKIQAYYTSGAGKDKIEAKLDTSATPVEPKAIESDLIKLYNELFPAALQRLGITVKCEPGGAVGGGEPETKPEEVATGEPEGVAAEVDPEHKRTLDRLGMSDWEYSVEKDKSGKSIEYATNGATETENLIQVSQDTDDPKKWVVITPSSEDTSIGAKQGTFDTFEEAAKKAKELQVNPEETGPPDEPAEGSVEEVFNRSLTLLNKTTLLAESIIKEQAPPEEAQQQPQQPEIPPEFISPIMAFLNKGGIRIYN